MILDEWERRRNRNYLTRDALGTDALTQIFSLYPTPVGILIYAPPSPRAKQPYLA